MSFFGKIKDVFDNTVTAATRDAKVKHWLDEVGEAEKREKDWRKKAQEVVQLYEQEASEGNSLCDFNILYANTETLSPAVYNATPRPVVKRKTDKENPVAIAAAQVLKATLVYLTDTGDRDEATFDDLQKSAVAEALVPGRGLARFSYDAVMDGDGETAAVKEEYVCGEQVPWNRVVYGYAKNWHKIPWQAYEHFMTKAELVSNFGEELAGQIKLTHSAATKGDSDKPNAVPADAEGVKFAHIWEIWDKATKKIYFVSEGHPSIIKTEDDPLKLDGFFPAPRPIQFLNRISSLQPQTLYQMYEKQAEELEKATRRISGLLSAMKVRGFYDGTLQGLDNLLTKPENTLLPATNVAALQQGQSLEKAIWFMPLEHLIVVLQQLYAARLQIINTIHQITGIADIMRGASQASETLGAQEMKQAWGTMRLKRMQKEVQRFTRDCYRIQAELASKHFGIETFIKMTGVKLPREMEKQQAGLQIQQMAAEAQQAVGAAQQAGQPAPPPPPEFKQKAEQLQKTMSTPSWEEVQAFLKNDSIRNYVIDIETNSTIDIEATEDKAELAEMMNSMSQLLNGVFPMVKEGVLPFPAAKSLMLSVIGKFRLGDEVEETFRAMQEPPPKPDPAQQKVEAEMQRDEKAHEMDLKAKEQEIQQKEQLAQQELQNKRAELDLQREELNMRAEFARAKHAQDMEMLAMKAVMPPAAPQPQPGAQNASV